MFSCLGCLSNKAFANDLLIGKYLSETRENFGRDKLGEYEIEITASNKPNILKITIFQNRKLKYTFESATCEPNYIGYLDGRPDGKVEALCDTSESKHPKFVYVENGIKNPAPDYSKDPEKVKMMDKILKESGSMPYKWKPFYKTQFYAYVDWGFYGFRKVQ